MPRKRELLTPKKGKKRYVRRGEGGKFTDDQVDVGRSLAADRRKKAKNSAPKGHKDRGD
jgi:hypothetical protein